MAIALKFSENTTILSFPRPHASSRAKNMRGMTCGRGNDKLYKIQCDCHAVPLSIYNSLT